MKPSINKSTWIFAILLTVIAAGYGIFEFGIRHNQYTEEEKEQIARDAIQSAVQAYNRFQEEFTGQSLNLSNQLKETLSEGKNKTEAFEDIYYHEYPFWGTSIFKEKELWLWSDFAARNMQENQHSFEGKQLVTLERQNNVTYLSSHIPFFIEEQDSVLRFDLITRVRVRQNNILSIGQDSELNPSALFQAEHENHPVHFSFFDPLPENTQFKSILSAPDRDSVGVVYTTTEDFARYENKKADQNFIYRGIFYVLLILFTSLFLVSMAKELDTESALLLKLFAIGIAWAFFSNIEYGINWVEIFPFFAGKNLEATKLLIYYGINSLFILLITISVYNSLKNRKGWAFQEFEAHSNWMSLLTGILSFALIYFFLDDTYDLLTDSSLSVMDLDIFPPLNTLIFYILSAVFSFSLVTLLTMIGWLLLRASTMNVWLQLLMITGGFLSGLVFFFLFFETGNSPQYWLILTTSLFFSVILTFSYLIYNNFSILRYSSRLRLLVLLGYISVCITYIAVYKGYSVRQDAQMLEAANSFLTEEESQMEEVTASLIRDLERELSGLTVNDLESRLPFVESYFTSTTQRLIQEQTSRLSFSTQLVDNQGNILAEYTSDLDSPSWTRDFDMRILQIPFEVERIREEAPRPIVRTRPLNESASNYSAFQRGWIPLQQQTDSTSIRIGWILCSVYKEQPQFEKPLRAVMASETNRNWNSTISIMEYIDRKSGRSSVLGIPLDLPGYVQLPETLATNVRQDSILFKTQNFENQKVRELFISAEEDRIVRVATPQVGVKNHIFSLIRFFFCILLGGLILLASLSWKQELNILGHNRRFKDRLMDRFILASLLCLMMLTVTSYFAINNQNEQSVREQLIDKAQNLSEALSQEEGQSAGNSITSLDQITSTLDADASLFINRVLGLTTTTQIYSQHLLPDILPWDVYESLYNDGSEREVRTATLGGQELLIAYKPWLDQNGEIAGVAAIPTFLKAPKFYEQFLSTTSYLLGFYVVIFGFFIIGAAYISNELTAPLESLRAGLKKISGGDLETTLPVRSKDEIGSLTNAYNVMVHRLKELQEELAQAEREEAWKEMAQQVAHEIKNPLTPMKLNLQHLERQLQLPEADFKKQKPKIEKFAANMIEQIESLSRIASEFSNFAKPIEQEFYTLDVNEMVQSVSELYETEESLEIEHDYHSGSLHVRGAKDELRRVVINLVKNSHEAMPDGGKITLCTFTNSEKDTAFISVTDTGGGIPEENHENIFVPNFSTKSSGTGLGLAISKKIIEEHGGEISFVSTYGQGTTFTISLPLVEDGG